MAVTETKTGAWYGQATYGTELWSTASNTLAVDESVSATTTVNDSLTITEGVGPFVSLPSVSATITASDEVEALMKFTTTSVEATGIVNADQNDYYDGFRINTNFVNAYYGQGVYGASYYGDVSAPTEVQVPAGAQATGQIGFVSTTADNNTSISSGVYAELITDAELVVGDEVVVTAGATIPVSGSQGTTGVTTVVTQTFNVFVPETPDSATTAVGDATVAASAVAVPESVSATFSTTIPTIASRYVVESVEATGAVAITNIFENARPTFSGVSSVATPGNVSVSTTSVIFNVNNKDHQRTALVGPAKPRIVYVRAA